MRLLLVLALALVAGCGGEERLSAPQDLHEGTATVLESPEHGPELCVGGQADSLPPQCGGVPLVGWDWAAVDGEERVRGTTWGAYTVVGRYDGEVLEVVDVRPPKPPDRRQVDLSTPCDEPDGGWPVDAARSSEDALQDAARVARAEPDFAAFWVDHQAPPDESGVGAHTVLNVAFTGDLPRHEQDLRAVWGGALCVVEHPRSLAELQRAQDELVGGVAAELGLTMTHAGVDEPGGVVDLGVVAATDEQRAALAERYGDGVVVLQPGLVPVER